MLFNVLIINEKSAQRDADTARAGCIPARPLSQTHRQDRLQCTAPQLASAQCNYVLAVIAEQEGYLPQTDCASALTSQKIARAGVW